MQENAQKCEDIRHAFNTIATLTHEDVEPNILFTYSIVLKYLYERWERERRILPKDVMISTHFLQCGKLMR